MSYKESKSKTLTCKYENKNVIIKWLETSIDRNSVPVHTQYSCNKLFDCQTKYGSIDNIPNCILKNDLKK